MGIIIVEEQPHRVLVWTAYVNFTWGLAEDLAQSKARKQIKMS